MSEKKVEELEKTVIELENRISKLENILQNVLGKLRCENCNTIDLLHSCYYCSNTWCSKCIVKKERKSFSDDYIIINCCKLCNEIF